MNLMHTKRLFIFLFSILLISPKALPSSEEEISYDAIVSELSRSTDVLPTVDSDPFNNVQIHLGVGIANSLFSVQHKNGQTTHASQRGVQIGIGIDLFSPQWVAEGTLTNYGQREYDQSRIALNEFGLRGAYVTPLDQSLSLRLGAGLTARYLNMSYLDISTHDEKNGRSLARREEAYITPTTLVFVGLDTYLSRRLSIGAEVAARSSLTSDETPDHSALDLTLNLSGHF